MSDAVGQSTPSQDSQSTVHSDSPVSDVPLANSPDPTWPISTKMANEAPKEASPSSQSKETPLANNDSAISELANQTATDSGQVASVQTPPDDSPSPVSPLPAEASTEAGQLPSFPQSSPSSSDISSSPSVPSSPIEPPQVQSSSSDNARTNTTSQIPPDLATIKPEPSQPAQNAPLANDKRGSFGEILAKENPPSSSNPSPPSIPSTPLSSAEASAKEDEPSSFGDILSQNAPTFEPKINIEPIVPPKPSPVVTPQIPQLPISSISTSDLRQKANQKRLDKRQKNLDKIMLFIKETRSITNTDVQRLCRVSQSTATNYLTELEKKGLLKQQGIRGGAKYIL
ncbi:hypothetical protein A2773_00820 [Candidatus Gottesmanbacteria bacterium RIFCSPHIGHO2_01_FULL_39_10]|uniref:Uncharacterized protein n=1 Tax=Candidatus Gottesmanbacteria bacterium RIFCSPHIGHO2_01_FULL_39_10 TaxID=1798375 RepID=A0A1F5ZLW7_9BACT|nr:MAG: hypothetical protein A2773_00820 [Candidatus Gottesmanbacteria bacterium RIFCSPHIGHO2_01_FULL_39_10]